jgi:signal transduction histidine kinase
VTSSTRELRAVQNISEALFQSVHIDELLDRALTITLTEVEAESGSILLADFKRRELVFRCSIGESPVARGTAIPWDRGIAGSVFHSGTPAIINDARDNPIHDKAIDARTGHETRDMISLPLKRWGGDPIGVLNVINKKTGRLGDDDVPLLAIISAFTALAIQQSHSFEEAKLAEVARTVGNIGHDLKNLLTPVVSSSGLLREELEEVFAKYQAPDSRELCFEALGLIERTTVRIHHRVKEIADCVKGRSTPPHFAPCKAAAIVADVFATLNILAEEKNISLVSRGLEDLPEIIADERRLYTAVYNLVINAIPEVENGGSITVSGRRAGEMIALEVRDDGRGMTPEFRDSLFTMRMVSAKAGGTGLGTKIVKDVVDAHGGKISVESEPGRGTVFFLLLPVDARKAS